MQPTAHHGAGLMAFFGGPAPAKKTAQTEVADSYRLAREYAEHWGPSLSVGEQIYAAALSRNERQSRGLPD